ncbi:putative ammonium transporter sll1017 [Rhopilema esculentum]|uniref:putative ammonium transporter sll1017 n=1 Tax=Rhopilema esculentum TaxID=499914 RepID=UPI0031D00931|eukprot:gene17350-8935_t
MSFNESIASLNKSIDSLQVQQDILIGSTDTLLLMLSGVFILSLQAGFALLEVGCIKVTNVNEILLNNIVDFCIGTVAYILFGFGLSFGKSGGQFGGGSYVALVGADNIGWVFFQYTFAATATAIVSSVMVGRTSYRAYLIYSFITTGIVYPIAVHWAWSGDGWMSNGPGGVSYQDFAGSSVVHSLGGACGVCASIVLGKRKLEDEIVDTGSIPPSSPALVTLGYFILINGFFCFNSASQGAVSGADDVAVITKVLINTGLANSCGTLITLLVQEVILGVEPGYWLLLAVANGGLSGCVSICAGCNVVSFGGACIIGAIGGLISMLWAKMFHLTGFEDPCDSTAVHLSCGIWGTLACPLFDAEQGFFYTGSSKSMKQFGWNMLCCMCFILWGVCTMFPVYKTLDMIGILRADHEKVEHELALHEHDDPQQQHELENMESSFAALPGSSQHSAKTKDSPPKYKVASVAAAPSDFSDHLSDSTRQANITTEM